MPSFCAVLDCNDKYGHGQNVPFHKFPTKQKELLEKWIDFTQRPSDWQPSKWMSVCGLHFRDEDYRCLEQKKLLKKNAVPSVRTTPYSNAKRSIVTKPLNTIESGEESSTGDMDEFTSKNHKIDSNCRFCGFTSSTFVTFAANFEIFGMIQKCLPTLSICQDDNMPKEICRRCLKRLKNFARFIDKILETQASLQSQFRNEKGNAKPNERILKIKQEPVVRVKQENLDDLNAFFPDEVDEGCGCGEQDHDVSNAESQMDQKYQFCDFPVLNDQDIINNCDIMEIINLSDPFIDITNCENTIAEQETESQQQYIDNRSRKQQILPSASELLQSHFITEEHNYANSIEDFKEEWPIRHCYKTEKIEADECEPNFNVEDVAFEEMVQDFNLSFAEDDADVAATMTVSTTVREDECERSNKPIVTSVSSLNEANLLPIASFSDSDGQQTALRKKPNIVVLNESIVQSSHALQLQACTICQSKFFSIESLNHHYGAAHNLQITSSFHSTQPMVTVPSSNITIWDKNPNIDTQMQFQSYKTEKDIGLEASQIESSSVSMITDQLQEQTQSKRSSKNEIKILDMQQSFLQHQYHYPNQLNMESHLTYSEIQQSVAVDLPKTQQTEQSTFIANIEAEPISNNIVSKRKFLPDSGFSAADSQFFSPYCTNTSMANTKADCVYETFSVEARGPSNGNLEKIAGEYLELQKRYRRLQQKCRRLVKNLNPKKKRSSKNCFRCRICGSEFVTVYQLLRHKQSTPLHHIRKPNPNFFATCAGCEKFFFRKIALYNHMRYICQALPLRWLKNQIRTFKCRYCRRITFTHWRICRKHEVKCRYKKKQQIAFVNLGTTNISNNGNKRKLKLTQNTTCQRRRVSKVKKLQSRGPLRKSGPHECFQCKKVYPSLSSLNQHRITHTSLRLHQCEICQRIFKRRNGLTQHVRGFHMKLKPYQCPTCKHNFALKGDMRRCKHSALARTNKGNKKKTMQKTELF